MAIPAAAWTSSGSSCAPLQGQQGEEQVESDVSQVVRIRGNVTFSLAQGMLGEALQAKIVRSMA